MKIEQAIAMLVDSVEDLARRPSVPGRDGVGIDDVEHAREDKGRIKITRYLSGGKLVKEIREKTKDPIHRGVYKEGQAYEEGDRVTWGGSEFICMKDTQTKPETKEANDDWRLAVKRGRDGKDGKDGVLKPPPGPVKIG